MTDWKKCSRINTCSARENWMFAPGQLLSSWRERRPSNKGDLDSNVRGKVGRVYYTEMDLLVILFLWAVKDCCWLLIVLGFRLHTPYLWWSVTRTYVGTNCVWLKPLLPSTKNVTRQQLHSATNQKCDTPTVTLRYKPRMWHANSYTPLQIPYFIYKTETATTLTAFHSLL
jgi:hypothetical protein